MNLNTSSTLPAVTEAVPQPATQPLDREEIARALTAIRADSQRDPESYLRDTVVPNGGE
jgi:hypothetical protein